MDTQRHGRFRQLSIQDFMVRCNKSRNLRAWVRRPVYERATVARTQHGQASSCLKTVTLIECSAASWHRRQAHSCRQSHQTKSVYTCIDICSQNVQHQWHSQDLSSNVAREPQKGSDGGRGALAGSIGSRRLIYRVSHKKPFPILLGRPER